MYVRNCFHVKHAYARARACVGVLFSAASIVSSSNRTFGISCFPACWSTRRKTVFWRVTMPKQPRPNTNSVCHVIFGRAPSFERSARRQSATFQREICGRSSLLCSCAAGFGRRRIAADHEVREREKERSKKGQGIAYARGHARVNRPSSQRPRRFSPCS